MLWPATCYDGHFDCSRAMRRAAATTFPSGGLRLQPRLQHHLACASDSNRPAAAQDLALPSKRLKTCHEYRRNVGICLVNKSGLVFAARSANFADRIESYQICNVAEHLMLETDAYDRRVDDTQGTWQMPQVCHCCWNSYHNATTAWLTW